MFANKESLYINVIKYDTQLKLDFKKLNGDELEKSDNTVFLVNDEILSANIAHKINLSQKELANTYISSLLINDTTKLIKKDSALQIDDCTISTFNEDYDIVVLNTTLFETKHYFAKTGVDYIYSAFHILNLHLEQNVCKNELVCFLFNNKAFIVILDDMGSIVYSNTKDLPVFEDVKQSHFYEDDVVGQKLFDEMVYLEFNTIIQNELSEFYKKTSDTFIEKLTVLYSVKQFSKEDIDELSSEILLPISYHPINVEEEMFELSQDKHQKKSFIKPRQKEKKSKLPIYIFAFFFSLFILYIVINEFNKNEENKVQVQEKQIVYEKINLPNHENINKNIQSRLISIFETVPYDVVLNSLILKEDSLLLDADLLREDTFLRSMKNDLEVIYKDVNIRYKEKEKDVVIFPAIINGQNPKDYEFNSKDKEYLNKEYFSKQKIEEQLKLILPKDSIVKYQETKNIRFSTSIYKVSTIIEEPSEFLKFLDTLNNGLYSVHITLPLSINKVEDGLEIEFFVSFNQRMN